MLTFSFPPSLYRHSGFFLLAAQFSLFVLALPPFQAGIWLQTEQIVYALFLSAMAAAVWCLWGLRAGALRVHPCHRLWYVLLLWILWQGVATLLAPSPWRSWFGPPETGEGVAWYITLFLLMLLASPFWRSDSDRRILITIATGNLLLQCALHVACPLGQGFRYIPGSWRPATWAAYLAFMGGYVWLAWASVSRTKPLWQYAAMTALMVFVLWVSENKSAEALLGGAMMVSLLAHQRLHPARFWRAAAMLACVLPLGWIAMGLPALAPYTRMLPPSLLSSKDSMPNTDGSIGSRISLNQMGAVALAHEPRLWLVGKGWGGFSDIAFAYALVDGVHVYQDGERHPNNLMVDGYSFHSHNQPLEALLALGLPGLALLLALPLVLLASMPSRLFFECAPMLVGLTCLSNLWFEQAQCLPFRALAMAALASVCTDRKPVRISWLKPLLAVAAVAMWLSAWQHRQAMEYGIHVREAAHALPYGDYTQDWLESDIPHGGDRLRSSALFYVNWLQLKASQGGLDSNDKGWIDRFTQAADAASQSPFIGASVASMALQMDYSLLSTLHDPVLPDTDKQVTAALPELLVRMAYRAPLRDDLATPYLLTMPHVMPDTSQQMTFVSRLLMAAPNHRAALWVMGGLLGDEEGQALRSRAVQHGVEKIYPVPQAELELIKR